MAIAKHRDFRSRERFASLDGLRCLAILAVIWHHAGPSFESTWTAKGFLGVDLFFVLSGFLIVTLLLRERDRTGAISLGNFYARRALRIFPAYYMTIALAGVILYLMGGDRFAAYLRDLPYLATYTSNWVHVEVPNLGIMWSLATEEQFYLLWPMVEVFAPRRAVGWILAAAIAVNQAVNFGFADELWRSMTGTEPDVYILPVTFTPILLGVALAHILHSGRSFDVAWRLLAWRGASGAFAIATVATVFLTPPNMSGWPRLAIQSMFAILIGSVVVREDHALRRPLTLRPV
ncbi:MAG: acyltransferase family protein, partial [Planctomycetota bacterium]